MVHLVCMCRVSQAINNDFYLLLAYSLNASYYPRSSTKLTYPAWSKYIEELAASKNTEVDQIKDKLANCGPPGTNGATVSSILKNSTFV